MSGASRRRKPAKLTTAKVSVLVNRALVEQCDELTRHVKSLRRKLNVAETEVANLEDALAKYRTAPAVKDYSKEVAVFDALARLTKEERGHIAMIVEVLAEHTLNSHEMAEMIRTWWTPNEEQKSADGTAGRHIDEGESS